VFCMEGRTGLRVTEGTVGGGGCLDLRGTV
jgi:hypothetical protein